MLISSLFVPKSCFLFVLFFCVTFFCLFCSPGLYFFKGNGVYTKGELTWEQRGNRNSVEKSKGNE